MLVSKKKFPIYVLQDAADRLFYDEDFRKPVMMDTWWNTEDARWNTEEISNDTYYAYYPTREPKENRKYTLDDLDPVSKKKPYALFPVILILICFWVQRIVTILPIKKEKIGKRLHSFHEQTLLLLPNFSDDEPMENLKG